MNPFSQILLNEIIDDIRSFSKIFFEIFKYDSLSKILRSAEVFSVVIFLFVKLTILSRIVNESRKEPSDFLDIIETASSSNSNPSFLQISFRQLFISESLILLKS